MVETQVFSKLIPENGDLVQVNVEEGELVTTRFDKHVLLSRKLKLLSRLFQRALRVTGSGELIRT